MTRNTEIGRHVQAWRGSMSQAALAANMKARGHKWAQATVWSIEAGERPLRLAEAVTLVEILGAPGVDAFLKDEDDRAREVRIAEAAVQEAEKSLRAAYERLAAAAARTAADDA